MSGPEERLRDALQADEPAALDPERIIRSARHRRAMNRVRLAAVAAVVVVGGVVGVPAVMEISQNDAAVTARAPEASARSPLPVVPDHASEEPSSAPGRPGPGDELIPGRAVVMDDQRWCIVDLNNRTGAHCADRGERSLRTTDADGVAWRVVVAPSGPRTAVLQVEQERGWADLRTRSMPGSAEHWVGVVPAGEVPGTVGRVRALDDHGVEVWMAD